MESQYFPIVGDRILVEVEPFEAGLLTELIGQVRALLMERDTEVGPGTMTADLSDEEALFASLEGADRPVPPPTDDVLARLLPAGRRDTGEHAGASAAEFRRLTEGDLRRGKLDDADRAVEVLQRTDADGTMTLLEAQSLLRAINDVRLSLGARLGVEEDTSYPREIRDERDQALAVYFWTGGIQEELVAAVVRASSEL